METKKVVTKPVEPINTMPIVVLGIVIAIAKFLAILAPTAILIYLVNYCKKNFLDKDNHWAIFWSYSSIIASVVGAVISINKLIVGGMNLSYEVFYPIIVANLVYVLPMVLFSLISVSKFYFSKDLDSWKNKNIYPYVNKVRNFPLVLVIVYPIAFLLLGLMAKKISWILTTPIYLTPSVVLYLGFVNPISVFAFVIFGLIYMYHAYISRQEYTIKTDRTCLVELVK